MSSKAVNRNEENWQQPNEERCRTLLQAKQLTAVWGSLMKITENFRINFDLPFRRNNFFVGRQDALKQLDSVISQIHDKHLAVIYGIGGIGKTELVAQYIYSRHGHEDAAVLWLDASNLDSLRDSSLLIAEQLVDHYVKLVASGHEQVPYARVAESLDLKGMLDDTGRVEKAICELDSIVRAVMNWLGLESNKNWLLVYDNYDDPEAFAIVKCMPLSHAGNIIITSRCRDCARLGKGLEMGNLTIEDGVELLLSGCQMFSTVSRGVVNVCLR